MCRPSHLCVCRGGTPLRRVNIKIVRADGAALPTDAGQGAEQASPAAVRYENEVSWSTSTGSTSRRGSRCRHSQRLSVAVHTDSLPLAWEIRDAARWGWGRGALAPLMRRAPPRREPAPYFLCGGLFVCLFASGRAVCLFVFVCVLSSRCLVCRPCHFCVSRVGTPPARQNIKIVTFADCGVVAAPQ